MRMPEKKTISDLLLEQYYLGELPARLSGMVKDELSRDAGLRARLEALADSNGEIMARYPAEIMAPAIRERLLREGGHGGPWHSGAGAAPAGRHVSPLAWALPVAAMVVLALSFFVLRERTGPARRRV